MKFLQTTVTLQPLEDERLKVNKEGKLLKMKLKSLKRRVSIILALCFLISCTSPMGTVIDLKANVTVDQFYDFRNGSIVPTDTDGKSDITSGDMKINVGTQNAYQYNGTTHGVLFKAGNSIEFTVPGAVTITVGDCLYSEAKSLTLTDARGTYSQTVDAGLGNYHNGSTIVFRYEGEATVLTLKFDSKTYIPCIHVSNQEEVEEDTEEEDVLANPDTSISEWYFDGIHADSYRGNIQKNAAFYKNIYVDATTGKFTARISENGYTPDQGDTQVGQGTKLYIPVATKSNIYVITNSVADMSINGTTLVRTGTVSTTEALSKFETTGNVYTYENTSRKAGYVCLDFIGTGYLKGLFVEYAKYDVPSVSSKTDVWDFSGKEEDREQYNSYITEETYSALDETVFTTIVDNKNVVHPVFADAEGGTSNSVGSVAFGDLTLNYRYKDRLYTENSKYSYSNKLNSYTTLTYEDGYQAQGGYFANGTSSEKHRNITIANVEAGDIITVYMTSSREASDSNPNPTDKLHFVYTGSEGKQDDIDTLTNKAKIYTFTAKYNGTYKIYAEAANGTKPVISRVTRKHTMGVISGKLDFSQVEEFDDTDYGLVLLSEDGDKFNAILSNDGLSYYVVAPADNVYTAVLTDAKGFEISKDSRTVAGGLNKAHDFVITPVAMHEITGTISGFSADYNVSDFGIVLEAENYKESIILDVNTETMTFTGLVEDGVNYTIRLKNVNDYAVTSETTVCVTEPSVIQIEVAESIRYEVTGSFLNVEDTSIVSNLVFTNTEDGYAYAAKVTETGYTAMLRDGVYQASATVKGYSMNTVVVVNGQNVTRDLLFIQDKLKPGSVEWAADIYVGYETVDSIHNYATLNKALEVAKAMNPKSEEQRITIHIAPGTYREQVVVQTPYVSLVNDSDEEVLVTWYYGIGYEYYSVDESGYYNESAAYNKNAKNIASKWGCSVYVQASATGFRASNIIFENSFNRYLTEEELADGVSLSSRAESSIKVERTKELDVKSREATERAAAMVIEADRTEFKNCQFLSSQDTLYTAPKLTGYFLDCKIEGGVDYIFGYGDYVFDSCELSFYGYSNKNAAGYITACRTPKTEGLGYLFNNCTVTGNKEQIVAPGYFGRPWGADATVTFLNTKLADANLIQPVGWYSMSGVAPEQANYSEFGTVLADGTLVDTSDRVANTVLSEEQAAKIVVTDYFGSWVPAFYNPVK